MAIKLSFKRAFGGYTPVIGFVLITAALFLAHQGRVLNIAFPAFSLVLAFYLFLTHRSTFVAFVWWIWLFTPFVRRVVDYQTSFHKVSPVILTPLLVTAVALIPLLRRPRFLFKRGYVPFLLVFLVYVYALMVGAVVNSPLSAIFDFAQNILPLGFGLFLMDDHKRFLENRVSLLFAIILGLLIMALYGLYQFYHMPPWDSYWLQASKLFSAGSGLAEQTRLFGTLNSPGPFATIIMASLIFVLVTKGLLRLFAGGFGFPIFGLTLVRSDWGGFVLATIFVALCIGGKARLRLILIGFGLVLVAYPLVTVGPVADSLSKRLSTFNNISQDHSYKVRQQLYETFAITAISQPIGVGFGALGQSTNLSATSARNIDSGILQIPYEFGWVFGALFVWALFTLSLKALGRARKTSDSISIGGGALFLVLILLNVFSGTFSGVAGMALWVGFAIAIGPATVLSPVRSSLNRNAVIRPTIGQGIAGGI